MQNEDLDSKLNKREKYKARLRPIDYFKEFDSLDFDSLGEGDRFYLQDFGIFNTDFLEDEFTMRLRIAAGRLTPEQFSLVADVVDEYDLTIIITARGGLQLHELEADNVAEIWKKLNSHGLTTWQSFGDNIRNIVSDVYDGRGKYAKIEKRCQKDRCTVSLASSLGSYRRIGLGYRVESGDRYYRTFVTLKTLDQRSEINGQSCYGSR